MLPLLQHYIDSLSNNLFVVIHTYGSHFNYHERYPRNFAHFLPDNATEIEIKNRKQLINAYDNSIRYTDYFLNGLIRNAGLNRTVQPHCITVRTMAKIYWTITGNASSMLHHTRLIINYTFRFYLVFRTYQKNIPPGKYHAALENTYKPVSTRIAFHTMLDIASIRTRWLDTTFLWSIPRLKAGGEPA